jgi:hypothetical protein
MKNTSNNDAPHKLTVAGLSVDYWPRQGSVYVEATDDSGEIVLACEWTMEGRGDVTIDEISDEDSDRVFSAVNAAIAGDPKC